MAKALSPAKVKEVRIHEDTGVAEVIVPDFQLSLAIGREGQNARLAARLTGWRVDIKSETQRAEEDAGIFRSDERYEREEGVEYAEGEWVPNAQTGELEWHAADGTVVSAQEWAAGDPEASPTDASPEEAVLATEEAADAALDTEVEVEAELEDEAELEEEIELEEEVELADALVESTGEEAEIELLEAEMDDETEVALVEAVLEGEAETAEDRRWDRRGGWDRRRLIRLWDRSGPASAAVARRHKPTWCGWHGDLVAASW